MRFRPRMRRRSCCRHLHGYSNREIAHGLGVPERTIASRLAAARAKVQVRFADLRETDSGTFLSRRVASAK